MIKSWKRAKITLNEEIKYIKIISDWVSIQRGFWAFPPVA